VIDLGRFLVEWIRTQPTLCGLLTFNGLIAVQPSYLGPGDWPRNVTYTMVSDNPLRHLKGRPRSMTRVQLDVRSRLRSDAVRIARLIVGTDDTRALDQYRGTLAGVTVAPALKANEFETYEEPADAKSQGWHRVVIDFNFWHEET